MTQPNFYQSYAQLGEAFAVPTIQEPIASPQFVYLNHELARDWEFPQGWLGSDDSLAFFNGEKPKGWQRHAMAYAGHQFGQLSPTLGDGRALLLGEWRAQDGQYYDLHAKGTGRTAFSRNGDGKATLGAVMREVVMGHALHHLGVPTSRALAAFYGSETIMREDRQRRAVLIRVAKGHVRIGTFTYFRIRQQTDKLRQLADYAIARWYPHLTQAAEPYLELLLSVVSRQAELVAKWMHLGFIHGVINTDNTSISAETFDYGPCAFLDTFDPHRVYSSIDTNGRYAYANQPRVIYWNLSQFAHSLLPLLHEKDDQATGRAQEALNTFPEQYHQAWLSQARAKLGLHQQHDQDQNLATQLLQLMAQHKQDYSNTWRALSQWLDSQPLMPSFDQWVEQWRARLTLEGLYPQHRASRQTIVQRLHAANPALIPRNHLVAQVIDAANMAMDFTPFTQLLEHLSRPYDACDKTSDRALYTQPPSPDQEIHQTFCGT